MNGCKQLLAHNQGYSWCGQISYGGYSRAICEECGGPYKLRGQYGSDTGPRETNRYSTSEARQELVKMLKSSDKWIPWLYMRPIR